jgi:hypothetical protein
MGKETTVNDWELRDFQTPLVQYFKQDPELFRVYTTKAIGETIDNTLLPSFSGFQLLYKKLLFANTGQISHIYYPDAYEALRPMYLANLHDLLSTQPAFSTTPVLTLLNVKYLVDVSEQRDPQFIPVARTAEAILYRNTKYLPRVLVVPQAVYMTDDKALYGKFIANFDPMVEILLEDKNIPGTAPGRGEVELLSYDPREILLKARVESEQAWVLLADTYFPGWHVSIDGIPARIYKADYVLRGVLVPVGRHIIKFRYSPLSFRLGLFTSLTALFVLSLIWLVSWYRVRS